MCCIRMETVYYEIRMRQNRMIEREGEKKTEENVYTHTLIWWTLKERMLSAQVDAVINNNTTQTMLL